MNDWIESKGPIRRVFTAVQDLKRPDWVHMGVGWAVSPNQHSYLRSEDEGRTFREIGGPEASATRCDTEFQQLYVCPTAPKRLYAWVESVKKYPHGGEDVATRDNGILMLSDDLGQTWRSAAMRGFQQTGREVTLAVDPTDAAKLYLLEKRLWRSADSGETWTLLEPQQRGVGFRIGPWPRIALTRSGVRVVLIDGAPVQVEPGSDTWRATTSRPRGSFDIAADACIVADPHHKSRLWRTGAGRLWRSDDGRRWEKLPGPENIKHVTCDAKKPGRLAVVASANAWLSTDSGRRWRSLGSRPSDLLSSTVFAGENLVGLSMSGIFWRKLA